LDLSVEVENVKKDVRMRVETDSIMSTAWLLIYLVPIILAAVWAPIFIATMNSLVRTTAQLPTAQRFDALSSSIFALLSVVYVIGAISFIANVIFEYKLVKRRNTHFKRQSFLFEDILASVKAIAGKKGVNVEAGLGSADRTLREVKAEETEKNAVLWALLSAFVPIVVWYVWYFLMKDFYKHERREDGFWEDTSKMLDKCGARFSVPRRMETVPDRSFALYLIVSIVTFGVFNIYWFYVLLKDPNHHFQYHIQIEDPLLSTLESIAA